MGKLYKQQIIDMVAKEMGSERAPAARAVAAVLSSIGAALAEHDKVTLVGFGSFEVRPTRARTMRAIGGEKAGEMVEVPASHRVAFSTSPNLVKTVRDARR